MTRRRGTLVVVALIVAFGAILALSRPRTDPYTRPPLDPRSTGPGGLAALVALARQEGATVRLGGLPTADDDVVLQARDTLSGGPARRLRRWVGDGGHLVVTSPTAALAPAGSFAGGATAPGPDCELDALRDLGSLGTTVLVAYDRDDDAGECFTLGDSAGVSSRRFGGGQVTAVGSTDVFVNRGLGQGDDAALALRLLGAGPGATIRVLDPNRRLGDDEVGDGTILGALPRRGRQAVAQIVVAFLVWGLVRGRRLGRPVLEDLPVPLPASDLVLATAELLGRRQDTGDAAERLRRRARRRLGVTLGLGPDPHPGALADAVVARANASPELARRALLDPVLDDVTLVAVARDLDRLMEDLHGTHATARPPA